MRAEDDWSARAIKERCTQARRSLAVRALATPEELSAYWPGGAVNPTRRRGAWIFCYANYVRFLGRGEADPTTQLDTLGLQALAGQPVEVQLLAAPPALARPFLSVYPKGGRALLFCHARDWRIGWLATACRVLQERGEAADHTLLDRATDELAYQMGLLFWVLTSPGPGLPFAAGATLTPPPYFADLDPVDIAQLNLAHAKVNGSRLALLRKQIQLTLGPHERARDNTFFDFFGNVAIEMGSPLDRVLEDWSLEQLLSAVLASANAREHAKQDAEATKARPAPEQTVVMG